MSCIVYQYLLLWNGSHTKISVNVSHNIAPSCVDKNIIKFNLSSGKNLAYQGSLIHSKQCMNWDVNYW